jgi:Tol biopolymer transport system component
LRYAWIGGVVALAAIALAGAARFMSGSALDTAPAAPVRFTVGPPEKGRLPAVNTNVGFLSISPDGRRLAFVAASDAGRIQLFVRELGTATATALPGTDAAGAPFWSPDSRFVAFSSEGRLKKIAIDGGPAQTIAERGGGQGSWSSDGVIAFATAPTGGLFRVPDSGGSPVPLTTIDEAKNEIAHAFPSFLPDGDHFLFFARSSDPEQNAVYLGSVSSPERKRLLLAASAAVYVEPGYLLFHRDGTLMAQPFDAAALETTGEATPIAEGVQFNPVNRGASFAASQTGVLTYRLGAGAPPKTLVWVDRKGIEEPLAAPSRGYQQPRLSPDGRRIAVQIEDRGNQIWVYDLERETLTRLTFEGSQNEAVIWTPDGKRVTYYSNQAGPLNLFWQTADGSGGSERLTTSQGSHAAMSWSSDGQRLAYTETITGDRDIFVLDMADKKAAPFLKTPFIEGGAQFSPDGRWIAYVSNESGRTEVYVQPYPGPGGKWQISAEGGSEPIWNRNGRELFYRSGDRMMAVPVTTGETFSSGRPQLLFERRYASIQLPQTFAYYDVTPDGQRFLMVKETEQAGTPIEVILNWPALMNTASR